MSRSRYRNRDPIDMPGANCDGCQVLTINGVLTHEIGCPHAWKDYPKTCIECNRDFYHPSKYQRTCQRRRGH